ncbi:maleylpyruvate isomerase N-terminal domain-containing protein [Rhodococcus artemisiae]|uniref:Maleylpyruvate isomerase N-terminal domain-containing protein n=1 Tax=Rhodococcus artemisiae TaxID=714159 RepID=A0ABU7L750_9NOCA|nr:maleylpyruvate isomerase N-terminal domain-containing protein [Rhodococcus artemisiae]MEE2057371.1 maleylpyruvate isomerase N-terminal domain-containing protein [Rhodococcus artemisiae]
MSESGVAAARALSHLTVEMLPKLSADDWSADSACHGWRVHDVISHMGFFFNFIADPHLVLPENPSGMSERLNDAAVRERADWSTTKVIDYYQEQSTAGLATLEALQSEEMRDVPVEMLDLGTYRMAQLSDAVAFDHLVHLTSDLLAPCGPLAGEDSLGDAFDAANAIDPAIDWMIAGLPQMCGGGISSVLERPVGLELVGSTERRFVIDLDPDNKSVIVAETDDLPDDVATSDARAFLRWGTTRSAWRSVVGISGERGHLAAVLDAVDIV